MVQELVIHTTPYLPSPSLPLSLNSAFFNVISLIFESARVCVYTSPAFGPQANPLISCMTNSPTSGGINQTQTHMHMWTDTNTQRDEKWEVKNVCGNTQINAQAIYTSAWKRQRVCVCMCAHCPAVILSIPNKHFNLPYPPPPPPGVSHNASGQVPPPPPCWRRECRVCVCVCERMDKGEEWMGWFISLSLSLSLVTPFERA